MLNLSQVGRNQPEPGVGVVLTCSCFENPTVLKANRLKLILVLLRNFNWFKVSHSIFKRSSLLLNTLARKDNCFEKTPEGNKSRPLCLGIKWRIMINNNRALKNVYGLVLLFERFLLGGWFCFGFCSAWFSWFSLGCLQPNQAPNSGSPCFILQSTEVTKHGPYINLSCLLLVSSKKGVLHCRNKC